MARFIRGQSWEGDLATGKRHAEGTEVKDGGRAARLSFVDDPTEFFDAVWIELQQHRKWRLIG